MKKVIVTGGAGFIGSSVAEEYIREGFDVIIVDNLSTGKEENIPNGAKFYNTDIRNFEAIDSIINGELPDIVNHHAAQASVPFSMDNPEEDLSTNIVGSINLIKSCIKNDIQKFIYISTGGAVYGEPQYLPCDENHPVNPLSPYGVSKHTVEHYLYLYKENYGFNYAVLRYPNVYGLRQDPFGECGVVSIFISRMLNNQRPQIFGDGNQKRDFVYVKDIAHANLLLTLRWQDVMKTNPAVFNIGSGKGISVNQLFKELKEITDYNGEPEYLPKRPGDVRCIYLKAEKARDTFGWEPKTNLTEGLKNTVDWFHSKIKN